MTFPPDLCEWLSDNSMVYFIIDIVKMLDLQDFPINHRSMVKVFYQVEILTY
jgi:hypothetical protein